MQIFSPNPFSELFQRFSTVLIRTLVLPGWIFFSLGSLYAQADLAFSPSASTVNVGDNGTLLLQVQAGTQLVDGVEVHLDFDPSLIQISSLTYEATTELPLVISAAAFDNSAGTIDVSSGISLSGGTPVSGTFDYLTINYSATAAGIADITYDFTFPTRETNISLSSSSVIGVENPASITINNPAPFQVCVGCGNTPLSALGRSFLQDNVNTPPTGQPFTRTNGKAFKNYSDPIAGTTPSSQEELLFQKEIYGGAGGGNPSFTYDVPVANGTYQVDLYFAEIFQPSAGLRVFDVLLEGNVILDNYDMMDPTKDGLSTNETAITRTYYIDVQDGAVNIQIGPASVDNGKLSGFCVTEVPSANLMPATAIGNLTADAGVATALPLGISDPENDPLTVTLNGLPASLSYNSSTGNLEGTALGTDAGTYTINVIIADGTSSPITEELTLTINPPVGDNPPTIDPITDINVPEGGTASSTATVTDDNGATATMVLYDKSVLGTNNPFTPGAVVPSGDYTFADNGNGTYTFSWVTAPGDGRSYYAVVTADDGVNNPVEETFTVNVGIDPTTTFPARYFANPLPWYGNNPGAGFPIAIETNANQNIGFIDAGEFVEYWVDIPAAGTYDFTLAGAKQPAGITTIELSDQSGVIGTVDVVNNGSGWQDYANYTDQVVFSTGGLQSIRLDFLGPVNVKDLSLAPVAGNSTPVVQINTPNDGDTFTAGASITFTGTANDVEDGPLDASISWNSDVDGPLGTGASVSTSSLTVGPHVITASATDNDPNNPATGTASISITVQANQAPVVQIVAPANNASYVVGDNITFTGTSNDPEEGDLSASLTWTSNLDGPIGTGASLSTTSLSTGSHTITASSTDTDGSNPLIGTASITIDVNQSAPACNVTFRVNAGGALFNDPNGNFEEDQAGVGGTANGTASSGTPSPYHDNSIIDLTFGTANAIGSNNTGYADALFQLERYSTADTMQWSFPVANGIYDVKLLFCEIWTGEVNSPRVFDVVVEGQVALDDYRPSGPTGADYNVAKVESYQAIVTDGVLNIDFAKGTQNPAIKGFDICLVNEAPQVAISSPSLNQAVTRGTAVNLTATANDMEDGDISANIQWTTDDNQATLAPLTGQGASITGEFVNPGTTTVTASATDSDSQTGSESVTIDVNSPGVTFTSPTNGSSVNGPVVTMNWTATDVLYGLTEHFHLYVNPALPILDPNAKISTASLISQTTWDLGPADGIVPGQNTVVIVVADQFHQEFTDPGATDIVTFDVVDVDPPVITLEGANPQTLTVGAPYAELGATALDVFDGDISANIVINTSAVDVNTIGNYSVTYDVSDASGNAATQVSRTVEVVAPPLTDVFLVVNPATQTVNENDVFTASVQVQANAQTLDGVEVHLTFDPTVLQVQSVTDLSSTDFPIGILAPTFDNTAGTIDFAAGNFGPSFPSGTMDLFSIDFEAVGGPSSGINFTTTSPLSEATFGGGSVLSGTTDALVNVNENPELVITPGTISVSVGIDGNTTETFVVDVNDASTLPGPAPITIIDDATGVAATWVSTVSSAAQGVSETLSFDATGLAPGTYTATMTAGPVTGYDNGSALITMVVQAPPAPSAFIAVNPGGGLGASTFGAGSWQITNTGNIDITSVSIDLSTGILPDMVWDPVGAGGDATAACLTPAVGAAITGFVIPTDPCVDPFSVPRNGGFDVASMAFSDFNGGEFFTFTSDNDPNSIQGVPGAGAAGSVSGYELIGATITINFADGTALTGSLFEEGTLGGANLSLEPAAPAAPSIELQGFPAQSQIIATDVNQTVTVTGNPGDIVTLLQMDSRLYIASGNPPFGVSPFDTIFYANEAMSGKAVFTQTVGAGGTVDIPVTLFQTPGATGTPPGGKNQFIAVTTPGPYATTSQSSLTSNVLTVRYFPTYNPAAIVSVNPGAALDASTFTGNSFQIQNTGTVDIVSVSMDLTTGFLMDVVFDPTGTAGDAGAKCVTPDAVVGTPGYVVTTDPCVDPFVNSFHNGIDGDDGYDIVALDFSDFNGGEQFNFSVDQDPTSIKNDITTGDAGAISGAELVGTTVTIQFADGTTLTRCLWTDGSDGGSAVDMTVDNLSAPSISMQGFGVGPVQTSILNQTIDITGPANANIELLQWDARLYIDAGSPNPYDIDPFEANEVLAKVIYTGTTDASGNLSIPVTLLETPSTNLGPDGGLNHFMAVVADTGITSCLSNVVIAEVLPFCAVADLTPVLCEDAAVSVDLTTYQAAITSETGTFAYTTAGNSVADPTDVMISDGQVIDVAFNGTNGCVETSTITFTVNPVDTTNIAATTCDPAQVGTTQVLLTNQFGCDSLVVTTTVLVTISANLSNVACNDNGTPNDPSDDYVTFDLTPSGSNLGDDYALSGDVNSSEIPYSIGTTTFSTAPGTAGGGNVTVTVTDTASGCSETIVVTDPGACSNAELLTFEFGNQFGTNGFSVCVPVTVQNYDSIFVGQGTLTWDPTVITFDSVTNFGTPGLEALDFTTFGNDKLLLLNVEDPVAYPFGVSLADDDTLFEICFTVVGQTGDVSSVTFTNAPAPIEWTKSDIGGFPVVDPYFVLDGSVTVIDPIPVTGSTFSWLGDTIEDVTYDLLYPVANSTVADSFEFPVPANQDGRIVADKRDDFDPDAGITGIDVILTQLHILNAFNFTSPYQLLAADVNQSGDITNFDVIFMENIILQNFSTYFPNGGTLDDTTLWRIIPQNYVFPDPTNPWNVPNFRDVLHVQPPGLTDENFLALKLGDVNLNWIPLPSGLREEVHGEVHMIAQTPEHATPGATIRVPVSTRFFRDIASYSYTLNWDPAALKFVDLHGKMHTPSFATHSVQAGKLPLLWVQELAQGEYLADETVLYELEFEVVGNIGSQALIEFGESITPKEAYTGSLLKYAVIGTGGNTEVGLQSTSISQTDIEGYHLIQNRPNPFKESTEILFSIPARKEVTISIYNGLGQIVWEGTDVYQPGTHSVIWKRENQHGYKVANGVYTLVLTAGGYEGSLRMSVQP